MNIQTWLPASQSREGQALLDQYNLITHSIFFIVLSGFGIWILIRIRQAHLKEQHQSQRSKDSQGHGWISKAVALCRHQPLAVALMTLYGIAMVHQMTWFFHEIVVWYDSVLDDTLLNNFSLRPYFVKETMRRNDFRFFPLAHQDLHLLSWFTPYVKVWAMVSVVELVAIVALCCQFTSKLTRRTAPALLLMATVLILFQPSTATAFFQLIYSERILTLLLMGYAVSYITYQRTNHQSAFLTTLLLATVGLFFKDVAPLLFIVPAAFTLALGLMGRMADKPALKGLTRRRFVDHYRLELWLCALGLIFVGWFVVLSWIPSLYEGQNALRSNTKTFNVGFRYGALLLFSGIRCWHLIQKQQQGTLLDGLNASAILYSVAVYAFAGFQEASYLALPVQLVIVLDVLYAWSLWISPSLSKRINNTSVGLIGGGACALLIASDHLNQKNFSSAVHKIGQKQVAWQSAYNQSNKALKSARNRGEEINLIFTDSWFTHKRHLDRLPFSRLIFLDPSDQTLTVQVGEGKGKPYTPKSGDYLINIDRKNLNDYVNHLNEYEQILNVRDGGKSGNLYRRK